tara:strand:+ start:12929 stop:13561 length:633 start_codon:yes stop_codon:yes gene_type:complete
MLEFHVKDHIVFPTYVWETQITGIDNESILKFVYDRENQDPAGVRRSNIGGWHSHPYEEGDTPPDCFVELLSDCTEFVNDYCSKYTGIDNLHIGNYWFITNKKYDYNQTHHHMGSFLSCAYYIKAPENGGDIVLHRDDHGEYYFTDMMGTSEYTALNRSFKAKEGLLLIFPSWLQHSVTQNLSDETRVVLSINFCIPPSRKPAKERIGKR